MFTTLKQIQEAFVLQLQNIYSANEARQFTYILALYQMGYSKVDCLMRADEVLDEHDLGFFRDALQKLEQNIPVQHIIGETEFYGLPFTVNENVLIPRPETEELIQWIVQDCTKKDPKILDIGTGSGCIPITLKHQLPLAEVSSWDISDKALDVARHNAMINNVEVTFEQNDALNAEVAPDFKVDIMVSNPPYIMESEQSLMQKNVLEHEPHLALFVPDNNALLFYNAIADLATQILNPGGSIYFEINEALGQEMIVLMEGKGFKNVELRKDLNDKDRMLKAVL